MVESLFMVDGEPHLPVSRGNSINDAPSSGGLYPYIAMGVALAALAALLSSIPRSDDNQQQQGQAVKQPKDEPDTPDESLAAKQNTVQQRELRSRRARARQEVESVFPHAPSKDKTSTENAIEGVKMLQWADLLDDK